MNTTPPSLLLRLRNSQDRAAWDEFVQLYSPVIYDYCLRTQLAPADRDDLMSEVFMILLRRLPSFEYRQPGRFRGYLQKIVRHRHWQLVRRQRKLPLDQEPTDTTDPNEAAWEQEYNEMLYQSAMTLMKQHFAEKTWQSFYQTTVEGRPVPDVARDLGMTETAIYSAKFRITTKLRQLLADFYE